MRDYVCTLAYTEIGCKRVQTVDLMAVMIPTHDYMTHARLMAQTWKFGLGRYETVVGYPGFDFKRLYRSRTWQQALETHAQLVERTW